VLGLLALMLLHESRRASRVTSSGELVLLTDQDRTLWDRGQIADAVKLLEAALATKGFGPYTIQAAIAAVHAEAPTAEATDWAEIVALYDVLLGYGANPIVELNRAVAVAMKEGAARGLEAIDAILARGDLRDYHLAHAARGDMHRRLGRGAEASADYRKALALTQQASERRFLEKRLAEL
jgi:RNA polymerase sigma-70 factor, ECF subfamily